MSALPELGQTNELWIANKICLETDKGSFFIGFSHQDCF